MPWCCTCFGKSYEAAEVLELDYRHSSLTQVPPDVFTFERTLEKLCLASNQISDLPPSLFHCYELKELDLGDNDLTIIPAAIGSLTRLLKLDASRNSISEVADTIKNCKNLTSLDLSLNHLVKLPEGISQLVSLEELNLNDTYLEFLHANLGRLVKLKVLELRENSLQSLPKSMTRFTHLQRLDVGQNDLHDLPDVIGTMTNLLELWVDNNSLRSLPSMIGQLNKLTSIDASCNDIIEIADEIGRCTHLTDISLSQNSIEGLPDTFSKLESLTVLRLDSNQIQYLPEDFGNLRSLQELSVLRNLLKALPPSIGLLRKLHTLLLDDNLLQELPKEIGSCSSLTVLHVSKNKLHRIPSEIGHLTLLKVLALAGNVLIHLPVSLLNIPKLGALWLSESQSKPLLPLNKETDPLTGEHVITCYLLPQIPHDTPAGGIVEEVTAETELRPRRSLIKFAGFEDEVEEAPEESQVSRPPRPGLLRAPTPYPKELRALAKHASQIYTSTKQGKDQNGDVLSNDGAEYESERNGDARGHFYRPHSRPGPSGTQPARSGVWRGSSEDYSEAELRKITQRLRPTQPPSALSSSHPTSHSFQSSTHPLPDHSATSMATLEAMTWEVSSQDSAEVSPRDAWETPGSSEMAAKTPPPYHVAARRAAFFRTTAAKTASPTLDPRLQTTPNPGLSNGIQTKSESGLNNTGFSQSVSCAQPQSPDINTVFSRSDSPGLNRTFSLDESHGLNTTYTLSGNSGLQTALDPNSKVEERSWLEELEDAETECGRMDGVRDLDLASLSSSQTGGLVEEAADKLRDQRIVEDIVLTQCGSWPSPSARRVGLNTISKIRAPQALSMSKVSRIQPPPVPEPQKTFRYIHPFSTTALAALTNTITTTSGMSSRTSIRPPYALTSTTSSSEVSSRIPVLDKSISPTDTRGFNSRIHGYTTNHAPATPATTQTADKVIMSLGHSTVQNVRMEHKPLLPSTSSNGPDSGNGLNISGTSGSRIPKVNSSGRSEKHSPLLNNRLSSGVPVVDKSSLARASQPTAKMSGGSGSRSSLGKSGSGIPLPGFGLERVGSGSRIPRRATPSPPSSTFRDYAPADTLTRPRTDTPSPPPSTIPTHQTSGSGRKPWIFGTHRNARVVPLEYKKVNALGFAVCNGMGGNSIENGVYVKSIEETEDSAVRIGDKILQVDGIDVSNMSLDIVRKILSNCAETINLLVSREN